MRTPRGSERAYRALLHLYPRRFRQAFHTELCQAFRLRAGHRRSGVAWALWFWIETVGDVLWNAVALRLRHERAALPGRRRATGIGIPSVINDTRVAFRLLRKQPGFSVVVVLTLALGIGVNTALFTVIKGVLFAPLPYAAPDRLVRVWENDINEGRATGNMSPADYFDYKEQNQTLQTLGAFGADAATLRVEGEPQRIPVQLFTPEVFEILGVPAMLGRTLEAGDDRDDDARVAVLSYGFWLRQFGGDSSVVGSTMQLGSSSVEIVGVMPRTFVPFWGTADVWLPWHLGAGTRNVRRVHYLRTVGRLVEGATLADARADLMTVARRLERDHPDDNQGHLVTVRSLEDSVVGEVRGGLLLLMGAVGFVLLIACANLANLFLSRGMARRRELALRSALGAGRGRLVRQMFTEDLLLAGVGALAGLGVAYGALALFLRYDPGTLPRLDLVGVDGVSLAYAMLLALVTACLFGLAPSVVATRGDITGALKEAGRGTTGSTTMRRVRDALVVVQMTLAIVLLVGAGLLLRSLDRLRHVDPGFESSGLLAGAVSLPGSRYQNRDDVIAFQRDLLARLEAAPTVARAGLTTSLPLGGGSATAWLNIVGRPPWPGIPPEVNIIVVSGEGYFRAMGVPLLAGRVFDERDRPDSPPVVVINRAAATQYWPDGDAVGQYIRLGPNPESTPLEIVGVTGDMLQRSLDEPPFPAAFLASTQDPWWGFTVVLRTTGDPRQAVGLLRSQVHELDPDLAVYDIAPMDDMIGLSTARPRFAGILVGAFALLALCIAAVGIYGVIAYSVAQRTQEIGVRMALGAARGRMIAFVFKQGMILAGLGLLLGLAAATATARLLASQLFEVSALDPVTFTLVPILLLSVALGACYLPALRAAKVSPLDALKAE